MSQDPYGQQPPYQPPHPNAPMHPAIQYAPVPTQKPEPTTVVKIGTYLIYAVALYMIMRAIVGLDDFGWNRHWAFYSVRRYANSQITSYQ